jgi:SAM-dependent methyltransferase
MRSLMSLTPAEWEKIERDEHDLLYGKENKPFGFTDYRIDVESALRWQDYCYKPNRRPDRGHRTRRMFELMDIEHLTGKKVLDAGCGNGQYAALFSLLGADVRAFDISPVGVAAGRRIADANGVSDRCRFSVQSASSMNDYEDATFDIVVFHEVLHHVIKYPGVREETLRVLKPGGIVVCAETLRGNLVLDLMRRISMRGGEAKGDVILDLVDIREFATDFSRCEIELMSLCFMLKRIVQNHTGNLAVRGFLYSLKKVDDLLFALFPSLQQYAGECVIRLTK